MPTIVGTVHWPTDEYVPLALHIMPLNDKSVDKNGHTLIEQSHGVSEISAYDVIAAMTRQEDRQELKA